MQHIKILLFFGILISILIACTGGDQLMEIAITPVEANINDVIFDEYSESTLQKICALKGNIHKYNREYPIECARNSINGYRVVYRGSSHMALIWFDADGEKIHAQLVELQHAAADFMEIELGETLETVRSTYPEGVYLFLYTGRNDTPRISSHYTVDGYIVYISYDVNYVVESITTELI